MTNAAVRFTFEERLEELGGIAAERVRLSPAPGASTVDDLILVMHGANPFVN